MCASKATNVIGLYIPVLGRKLVGQLASIFLLTQDENRAG